MGCQRAGRAMATSLRGNAFQQRMQPAVRLKSCLALPSPTTAAAAAMESYSRAYPHLVKLHMLQEIADVAGGWTQAGALGWGCCGETAGPGRGWCG